MHSNETRLWEFLKKYANREMEIRIVGYGKADLSEIAERFSKNGFINLNPLNNIEGFYRYGIHRLSSDRL
jgi:hypothetical protein